MKRIIKHIVLMVTILNSTIVFAQASNNKDAQNKDEKVQITKASEKIKRRDVNGIYNSQDAIKGQEFIKSAMNNNYNDLLFNAAKFNANDMFSYGLALELGVPPSDNKLSKEQLNDLDVLYQAFKRDYLYSREQSFLDIPFSNLAKHPEVWLMMSRSLGENDNQTMMSRISAGLNEFDSNLITSATILQKELRFNLKSEPIIKQSVASAANSCVTFTKAIVRMENIIKIDESKFSKIEPNTLAQAKTKAQEIINRSRPEAIFACGSEEFFSEVRDFASKNFKEFTAK